MCIQAAPRIRRVYTIYRLLAEILIYTAKFTFKVQIIIHNDAQMHRMEQCVRLLLPGCVHLNRRQTNKINKNVCATATDDEETENKKNAFKCFSLTAYGAPFALEKTTNICAIDMASLKHPFKCRKRAEGGKRLCTICAQNIWARGRMERPAATTPTNTKDANAWYTSLCCVSKYS